MSKLPFVAFDIDDVILDSFSVIVDEFKTKHNVSIHKPVRFCIENDCTGLSNEEVSNTIDSALLRIDDIKPIEGSIECLKFYQYLTKKELMFVTSRREDLAEATYDTLGKYLDNFIVFFSKKPHKTKKNILNSSGVDIFIEDRAKYCNEIADLGILVIMLKKSWNTHVDKKDNIIHVNNWEEISEIFKNLMF